jgi:hydrogenase maturation protein HypF
MSLLSYTPEGRSPQELEAVARVARDDSLSPTSSSCGRLFDAAAAMLGFEGRVGFEGEAAMWLEALASEAPAGAACSRLEFPPLDGPALLTRLADRIGNPRLMAGTALAALALCFHLSLAENLADAAAARARGLGLTEIALAGGVFQNRLFLEAVIEALARRSILSLVGERVPLNDGGISVGQAAAGILAARKGGKGICA